MGKLRANIFIGLGVAAICTTVPSYAQVKPSQPTETIAVGPEQALGETLTKMRSGTADFVFEVADGRLYVNGSQIIDPEGTINSYAFDPESGDINYTIRTAPDDAIIRFKSARNPGDAITIGSLYRRPNGDYEFQSETGVRAVGRRFTLSGNKIIIARSDAILAYAPGQGLETYPLPEGTYPAYYQRGNIGQTSTILIRLDNRYESSGNLVKATGELFNFIAGKKQPKEFALYDYTRKTFLPIDLQNVFQQDERLWNNDSLIPTDHYYWSVDWFKSGGRRIAVHFGGINDKIFVSDLDTGETKLAMSRGLGISDFKVVPNADGTHSLTAHWMFKNHEIPDIIDWFDNDGVAITAKKKK